MSEDTTDYTITRLYTGGPATIEDLQHLHHLVCVRLLDYMRNTPTEKLRAQMLTVVRSFLRDNGVRAEKRSTPESITESLESLAFSDMPFH